MSRLVHGVGVNDSTSKISKMVNGKQEFCPYYVRWALMLERCYSEGYQKRKPTYNGCTVCDSWRYFSVFKLWMEKQDWRGNYLDKDILKQGNKTYSPDRCIFVDKSISTLLSHCTARRGKYKLGVCFDKHANKFKATCSDGKGSNHSIGYFSNQDDAHIAYREYKYKVIALIASKESEPLKSALLNYKISEY